MDASNGQNGLDTSAETPLMSGQPRTSDDASGPVPRAPDPRLPPPYSTGGSSADRECEAAHAYHPHQHSSPINITKWLIAGTVFFNLLAALFCYNLPTKIHQYNEEVALLRQEQYSMIKQAEHLEKERATLRNESTRLEKERVAIDSSTLKMEGERRSLESVIRRSEEERSRLEEQRQLIEAERSRLEKQANASEYERQLLEKERIALDSSTLKMEGERQALESAIRRLEEERSRLEEQKQLTEAERLRLEKQVRTLEYKRRLLEKERLKAEEQRQLMEAERSRLEKQAHTLEYERQLLEKEEAALKEERERWERARDEQSIPQGAFWEVVWPAWDCRAYGKREYWGVLRNTPEGRTEMDACMNMPVEIDGVTIRRPSRCQYVEGSPYIHGFWMVDWDQPDCKPWHENFADRGCTNPGSGLRRIEAEVVGINGKGGQDWRLLCETTPMIWNHVLYRSPDHCDDWGRKVATWHVPDDRC